MSDKKGGDVKVLKGQDAEDKVLDYLKRMNRPFGAVDVAANLKGAVPKTAAQKILVSLAEKGALTQKTYGKTTFFVINQANMEDVPADKLKVLEDEHKGIEEGNKALAAEIKTATAELTKIKSTPTDAELRSQIEETAATIKRHFTRLEPLRSGASLVSEEELAQLDADWTKWRGEWAKRKKVFNNFWATATDALSPQDAAALAEDLGIELDTQEHLVLEKGPLCSTTSVLGKRRR